MNQYNGFAFKGLQRGPWNSTTGGEYFYLEQTVADTFKTGTIKGVFLSTKTLLPRFTWIKDAQHPESVTVEEIFSYNKMTFAQSDLNIQCPAAQLTFLA